MIISASRRTDIPSFYAEWFMNRIQAGYCTVPNPFNTNQVSRVSLKPQDVDVIVFWTRNPKPLIPHLAELNDKGYRYYFQYTLVANSHQLDPKSPPLETALKTFQELSNLIGPNKVIWRYDPIVFTNISDGRFHSEKFSRIAKALDGYTKRSVISIVDEYSKAQSRLKQLSKYGIELTHQNDYLKAEWFKDTIEIMSDTARSHNMQIFSCAEEIELQAFGVKPGKCIDDELIKEVFSLEVIHKKDSGERKACGCVSSKDIGMYDSCLFGCQYCYATRSFEKSKQNHQDHNPLSPSLIGWHDVQPKNDDEQLRLL